MLYLLNPQSTVTLLSTDMCHAATPEKIARVGEHSHPPSRLQAYISAAPALSTIGALFLMLWPCPLPNHVRPTAFTSPLAESVEFVSSGPPSTSAAAPSPLQIGVDGPSSSWRPAGNASIRQPSLVSPSLQALESAGVHGHPSPESICPNHRYRRRPHRYRRRHRHLPHVTMRSR